MPICPGCEQTVTYDRLDLHERYCPGLRGPDWFGTGSIEQLERRLVALEDRLDRRVRDLEDELERRSSRMETVRRAKEAGRRQ